jgi:phosphoribosylanthranilate isomerase
LKLRTRVKICGLTDPADARACRAAGADYLGLVFAGGPRRVDATRAAAIREAVPDAELVGVFADQPLSEVAAIATACRLDMIQLHGNESEDVVAEVAGKTGLAVIRAVRVGESLSAAADFLLFDLAKGREPLPGERERLWQDAAAAAAAGRSVFLAGKLRVEDVPAALAAAPCFALDVSSGVETATGRKDAARVRDFIEEVRRAR